MSEWTHTVTGLPSAHSAEDHSFAVFKFPVNDGVVTMKLDRLVLQKVAGRLSEVSQHLHVQTAKAEGHVTLAAVDAVNMSVDNLIGTGRVGVRLQTDNGQAMIYALAADQVKWLIERLSALEPVARLEANKTLQ